MSIVVICNLKIDRDNKLWISLLRKMVIREKNEEFRDACHESVWKAKPTISVTVQYALNISSEDTTLYSNLGWLGIL